jgi:hypothetical protein
MWGLGIVLPAFILQNADKNIPLSVLAVLPMAGVAGGYAWLAAVVTRRMGFKPVLLAVGWVGVEAAARWCGFADGLLAATQRDSILAGFVANVLGYGFVGFLIVLVNGALLRVADWARRPPSFDFAPSAGMESERAPVPLQEVPLLDARLLEALAPRAPPRISIDPQKCGACD